MNRKLIMIGMVLVLAAASCSARGEVPSEESTGAGESEDIVGRSATDILSPVEFLDCDHRIGDDKVVNRESILADMVALPVGETLQAGREVEIYGVDRELSSTVLFAKWGLLLRADAKVAIGAHEGDGNGIRAARWGNAADTLPEVFIAGPCEGTGWISFAGGYYSSEPACMQFWLTTPTETVDFEVGIDTEC